VSRPDGVLDGRLGVLRRAADTAWAIVREAVATGRPFAIQTKSGPADLVTPIDLAVERAVRELVLEAFPDDGFLGEEYGGSGEGAPWTWYLDPVDGTTNFAHRMPFASIALSVGHAGVLQAGTIIGAFSGARYEAVRGDGTRLDGQPVRVASGGLSGAIVATELMGARPWPGFADALAAIGERGATVRVMGSTAFSLALTASGSAAACLIARPHALDAGTGFFLVEQAGGRVEEVAPAGWPVPIRAGGGPRALDELRDALDRALR